MATNFEYYKDEILEIANKDDDFGVVNGEVGACCASKCDKCLFYICDGLCSSVSKIQWLYAEHIEQPKLTKRERAFCEAVQTGWIYKNAHGCFWTDKKPRSDSVTTWSVAGSGCSYISVYGLHFDAVNDAETVEDLLKLEVMEVQHESN